MNDSEQQQAPEEFSLYQTQSPSISEIKELREFTDVSNLTSLRIMHSINLKSMMVLYT